MLIEISFFGIIYYVGDAMNSSFLLKLYDIMVEQGIGNLKSKNKDQKEKTNAVLNYLNKLDRLVKLAYDNERIFDLIRRLYYAKYIIKKEDISDKYWAFLEKKYLEDGRGHYNFVHPANLSDEIVRDDNYNEIVKEQKESLDLWLNYLYSRESNYLPIWAKVWAFLGMLKIGTYDSDKKKYGRRSGTTVNPFVSLDVEILGRSVELLKDYLEKQEISDEELRFLVRSESFAKIYGTLLARKKAIKSDSTKGIWVKYNSESHRVIESKEFRGIEPEYKRLYNSLVGYNTGWCTASASGYAMDQLLGGDFYVYYTLDENGEYKVPRIAIRMEGSVIKEIRGIEEGQNLEANMEDVLREKLKEFADGEDYYKKVNDMSRLTEVYNKWQSKKELSKEDLRFIYEVDDTIIGFGHGKDYRINEILKGRNIKKDLSYALDCGEDEIGTNEDDLSRELVYYRGDITSIVNKKLPRIVSGDVNLSYDMLDADVKLPDVINGSLSLPNISTLEHITLTKKIGKNIDLRSLTTVDNLVLPDKVCGYLNLDGIKSLNGFTFPSVIDDSLTLRSVTNINNVTFSKKVAGDLILHSLSSMENTTLPQYVGYGVDMGNMSSIDNVVFPETIGEYLDVSKAKSAKGAKLPIRICGYINLCCLEDASGLVFPEEMQDSLNLAGVTSLEDVNLPETLYGNMIIPKVKTLMGIVLPVGIMKLNIENLETDEGLEAALGHTTAWFYYGKHSLITSVGELKRAINNNSSKKK